MKQHTTELRFQQAVLVMGLLMFFQTLRADETAFIVNTTIDGQSTSMDSILVENLTNGTQLIFTELPEHSHVPINISTQQVGYATPLTVVEQNLTKSQVVINTKGLVALDIFTTQNSSGHIKVFTLDGKQIYSQLVSLKKGVNELSITIPEDEIYVIQVFADKQKIVCKSVGSSNNASFKITHGISTALQTKSTSINNFSFNQGDLLRITVFKTGYQPNSRELTASNTTMDLSTPLSPLPNTVTDIDKNVYATLQIGTQTWMVENLKTSHYADGSEIPHVTGQWDWTQLADNNTDKAYCIYNNNVNNEVDTYGALYTWAAAVNGDNTSYYVQGACPNGWHIPRLDEWQALNTYLAENNYTYNNSTDDTKTAITLASDDLWRSSTYVGSVGDANYAAKRNTSGFNAKPSGIRLPQFYAQDFYDMFKYSRWWTSEERHLGSNLANYYILSYDRPWFGWNMELKSNGFSIRCIKNTPIVNPEVVLSNSSSIDETSATLNAELNQLGNPETITLGFVYSTTANPTIETADTVLTTSVSMGQFSKRIMNLTNNTLYYVKAFAITNMGNYYSSEKTFTTLQALAANQMRDYDGNVYTTTTIGGQTWMAENLKVTHYSDGTSITNITSDSQWTNLADNNTAVAYSIYNNNASNEKDKYGVLYTWGAVMKSNNSSSANPSNIQGICPDGWHVPSHAEWQQLENYISIYHYSGHVGAKLKGKKDAWGEYGYGTDDYAFNAKPSGYREADYGRFRNSGIQTHLWTSTQATSTEVYGRILYDSGANLLYDNFKKSKGASIRCIKD